jgi:hypothetical protein
MRFHFSLFLSKGPLKSFCDVKRIEMIPDGTLRLTEGFLEALGGVARPSIAVCEHLGFSYIIAKSR